MFAEWLADLGVRDVYDLATLDEAGVEQLVERMGRFGKRVGAEDWVGQARALLAGE